MLIFNPSPAVYSTYTIYDNQQFKENWQDAINEYGLTFWFGFENGRDLHISGDFELIVRIWSDHVRAPVYIHYFRDLNAYRLGQIYDNAIAEKVSKAVFILGHDPDPAIQMIPSLLPTAQQATIKEKIDTEPEPISIHHIRKPRNAWIIFRQEMMIKFSEQIGHLHTSEQSKAISKMWKKTPAAIKEKYTRRSLDEKANLLTRFPNYRVRPRKSSEIKKRVKNKVPADTTIDIL